MSPQTLPAFLEQHRDEIFQRWKTAVRECGAAGRLNEPDFVDHMPELLALTLGAVEAIVANEWGRIQGADADPYAHSRLASDLELRDVLTELFLLQHVLFELVEVEREAAVRVGECKTIGWAVDSAIRAVGESFVHAQHRALQALDRLSAESLGSRTVDDLLKSLLRLVLDLADGVDTVALFLLEDGTLRLRATAGIEEATPPGFRLGIGEGFAGRVALERRPLLIPAASQDPDVVSPVLREHSVKALYGIPLGSGSDFVGVLRMGSLTTESFSERDKVLLRAIADRAGTAISKQHWRDEREAALEQLSGVYATSPVGLATLSREMRFTRINDYLAQRAGLAPEALLGRNALEVIPFREYAEELKKGWRSILETGLPWLNVPLSDPEEIRARSSERRHWMMSYFPIRRETAVLGIGVVIQDVTEQKRAEEFQRMVLGIASHDLRTPLTAIRVSADALLEIKKQVAKVVEDLARITEDPAQRAEREAKLTEHLAKLTERLAKLTETESNIIARVRNSADRMGAMIRDLLEYTRLRAGQSVPLERQAAEFGRLCRLVVDEVAARYPDRTFRCDGPTPLEGEWDPGRLAQMMSNLVGNAAAYGTPNTEVVVRWRAEEDALTFEVENQGPPIPAERLAHLFDPFQRYVVAGAPPGPQVGFGLGLFVTREVVRMHGGEIHVRSAEGLTSFQVMLPRRAPR
jgi:PAS domain S-box-containing protein